MRKINPDHAVIAIVVFAMAITGCGLTLVATADDQTSIACNDDDSRRPPPPRDGERPRPTASDILEKDDANGNGVIDADEFPGPDDHFSEFDTDGNGSLSADEIEESLTKRPPPRQEDRRGEQARR